MLETATASRAFTTAIVGRHHYSVSDCHVHDTGTDLTDDSGEFVTEDLRSTRTGQGMRLIEIP
ncbi:UNVERIFIED_ORG: hypothetical protein FNL38_104123 [Nocardia globerula]|uniref:Uncharacterized protein n=1 Tax=Nocardia globerula TaxID=1818 RepID=A0A652YNR6_NOCGL